jgi:hypothetical protein
MTSLSELIENCAVEYDVDLLDLLSIITVPISVLAHLPKFLVFIELEN